MSMSTSQIVGESGADESYDEGEWRVWREADPINALLSKAGKRVKDFFDSDSDSVRSALLIAFVAETILRSGKITC